MTTASPRAEWANTVLSKRYPEATVGQVELYHGPLNQPTWGPTYWRFDGTRWTQTYRKPGRTRR